MNVELPNTITSIGNSAFSNCSSLQNIEIPSSVTVINKSTFSGCKSLSSVLLHSNIEAIKSDAFEGCISLKTLKLPESLESIDDRAFKNCASLESIDIPENLKNINASVFYGCTQLKNTIIFDGTFMFLPYSTEGEYTIPDGVKIIASGAFYSRNSVTQVRIPDSVTSIEAIDGMENLECIIIGKGVKNINAFGFAANTKLKKMICYLTKLPAVGEMLFEGSGYTEGTLYVPQECLSMYNAAFPWYGWGEIKAIEEMKPEGDGDNACEAPVISFENSTLSITSSTPNSKCYYTIEDNDIKTDKLVTNPIELSATYKITAYAVAEGYSQSSVTTATLVWLTAKLEQNVPTSAKAIEVPSIPVLISSNGGILTVTGMEEGTEVSAFSADGKKIDSAYSTSNTVTLNASSLQGNIAVVKVGDKSVKVVVK